MVKCSGSVGSMDFMLSSVSRWDWWTPAAEAEQGAVCGSQDAIASTGRGSRTRGYRSASSVSQVTFAGKQISHRKGTDTLSEARLPVSCTIFSWRLDLLDIFHPRRCCGIVHPTRE